MSVSSLHNSRRGFCIFFILLFAFSPAARIKGLAQQTVIPAAPAKTPEQGFRLERYEVAGGAELLTIFGTLDGLPRRESQSSEVPLVSVLRDTLGDADPENDRLRYLWMLTYTKPTVVQQVSAAVPFLYSRVADKERAVKNNPPPVIDLAATDRKVWDDIFWAALQNILIDPYGLPVKLSTRAYRRNVDDYRKAHVIRALAILSLYEAETGAAPAFNTAEMQDIQTRLMLTEKTLGGLLDDIYLQRFYRKQTTYELDIRGHNWELLRQRAEAESLYFEPLELPDGSATHALVWVARPDLLQNHNRRFESRFLNIANPWRDERLRNWKGYTQTRYFDDENRPVEPGTPGARPVQMIPLALYGLDHPKIPILLVDFRDGMNPKNREMSRRVLQDVTRSVLSISRFGDLPYFLGRTVYEVVTGRRGMDINQPSRLRAYSQLKLLLSLSASFDAQLRDEIDRRLERVSLNPLENGFQAEAQVARDQYAALLTYARRADGLPARLERDRRAEMVPLKHGRTEQVLFRIANILSLGLYTHLEKVSPEMQEALNIKRRMDYHVRFLREVGKSSPRVEVVWRIEDVRRSLLFIAEHGSMAGGKAASAAARIFARTEDEEARRLCLNCLYRINNETARSELLRIKDDQNLEVSWRELSAEYLRRAAHGEQHAAPSDAKAVVSVVGQ